jgi:DNA replication protein DnaC
VTDFRKMLEQQRAHFEACTDRPCKVCLRDTCPSCGGEMVVDGTMREIDGEVKPLKMCERCADAFVRQEAIREVAKQIPKDFAWANVRAAELPERVGLTRGQMAEAWKACVMGTSSLTLVGDPGAGKTSAAAALFRGLLDRGLTRDSSPRDVVRAKGAMFVSSYELARDRARHPLGQGESPLVAKAMRATVLVVDDLGSEPDNQLSAISDVIHTRHAEGKPTWVTTWLTETTAAARYGGGIARRIFERSVLLEVKR